MPPTTRYGGINIFIISVCTMYTMLYTGKISPPLIFTLFALCPKGKVNTGLIGLVRKLESRLLKTG